MYKPAVGDRVMCKNMVEAYYSGYAGRPTCFFTTSDVGTVVSVDNPSVWRDNVTFTRVIFERYGEVWSAALLKGNIHPVR